MAFGKFQGGVVPALAVLLALGGAACGSRGRSPTHVPNPPPNRPPLTVPPPKQAQIYGVVVPEEAELDPSLSNDHEKAYRLPQGSSVVSWVTFYARVMPPGQPHDNLEWCGSTLLDIPGRGVERAWRAPGTTNFLVLRLLSDPRGALAVIRDDRNDSSRQC